jgi:hypothetical protein
MEFVLKFKNIFTIEFDVDPLADLLLRRVYLDTEQIAEEDKGLLRYVGTMEMTATEISKVEDVEDEVKPFNMEEYMA